MSEAAKAARAANKAKAARLTAGDPKAKVDASSYTPPEMMNTEAKTGLRPVSRRAYKSGGKVHGEMAAKHAGRKPRKSGGATEIANAKVNRNVKEANADKFGQPHTGGYASGGYAKGGRPAKAGGDGSERGPVRRVNLKGPGSPYMEMHYHPESDDPDGRYEVKVFKNGQEIKHPLSGRADNGQAHNILDNYAGQSLHYDPYGDNEDEYNHDPVAQRERGSSYEGMKKGGRAKKMDGGPMGDPRAAAAAQMANAATQAGVPAGRMAFTDRAGSPLPNSGMKKGGKAENFEGSAKDEAQDKKLAKKRGMSMKEWEASEADAKHDKQQSMAGLKKGGRAAKGGGGKIGKPVHSAGDLEGINWPKDKGQLYQVRNANDRYVATYDNEGDARRRAKEESTSQRDATYAPVNRTGPSDRKDGGRAERKAGGRAAKSTGGDILKAISPISMLMNKGGKTGNYTGGTRPTGGRIAKAGGGLLSSLMGGSKAPEGKSKGKKKGTNINIVINAGKSGDQGMPTAPPILPAPPMLPPSLAGATPSAGAPMPMPAPDAPDMSAMGAPGGGMPGGMPGLPGRKAGGRVGHRNYSSYKDMDAGSGGGLGRLEKTEIAKKKYK